MNNDKSYNMTFQRMFDGKSHVSLLVLCAVGVVLFCGTVGYKLLHETATFNPFAVMTAFIAIYILTKAFLIGVDNFQNEIFEALWLGAMKVITGGTLIWSAFALHFSANVHDLEKAGWTLLAVLFLEAGIKSIAHSVFLTRKRAKQRGQELEAEKEYMKLEKEMAARWAVAEAERKRKAAIEDDLLSDLNSYLSET